MVLLDPVKQLGSNSRRITFCDFDSDFGSRVGGNAPDNVTPAIVTPSTRYFATIAPEDSKEEFSIFVSIDWEDETCYDSSNRNNLWNNVSKLQTSSCPLVQCLVHARAKRSSRPHLASSIDGRALRVDQGRPDLLTEPGGELLLPNKLGGRPYYYYNAPAYEAAIEDLFHGGFCLALQMTWAGFQQSPPGLWPFGDYTFHLLAKDGPEGIVWQYGWG